MKQEAWWLCTTPKGTMPLFQSKGRWFFDAECQNPCNFSQLTKTEKLIPQRTGGDVTLVLEQTQTILALTEVINKHKERNDFIIQELRDILCDGETIPL